MRWWRWKTDFWKGFTAYIEFATRDDATNFFYDPIDFAKKPRPALPTHGRSSIGAAAVALHNGKHEPKDSVVPILYLLEEEAPRSAGELLRLFSRRLVRAVQAWRDGELDEKQATCLDYFVRRGLVPRSLKHLEALRPLVEEYRQLEAEIPVPRRFPAVIEEGAHDQPLLIRGDPKKPGVRVPRRYLAAVRGARYSDPGAVRLQLADEIASPSNPFGFSMWMVGGGLKKGFVYGQTDEYGYCVVENQCTVHDLHATVLHLLGLDHENLSFRFGGRDYRLTDVRGHVIQGILA